MAFANPVTLSALQSQLGADAHQLQAFLDWITDRAFAYFYASITPALMTSLGISETDQTYITAFLTDLGHVYQYMNGNPQSTASNVRLDIDNILGIS